VNDQLGPESRALLDAARDGLGPDEVAIRRMRARVSALAAGGALGIAAHSHAAAATTATTTASTSLAIGGIAAKLAVVAITIGAAVGTRAVIHARSSPAPRAPIVEVSTPSSSLDRDELAPIVVEQVRETAPPPAPLPHVTPMPMPPPVPMPPAPPPPPPAPSLARETELVDAALAAMSHGYLAEALVAIERYTTETAGRGQLAEDAATIEIEARCRLRDPRAAEGLAAFEARWPQSAERARLVAACRPHE
jgi:hypothetical protein